MFAPLGMIAALGTGAMKGLETGMDLRDKYTDMQANNIAGMAIPELGQLGGLGAMSPLAPPQAPQMAAGGPEPAPAPPPTQPPPQIAPQQAMPGSAPIMPGGLQPGLAAAGMPPRVPQQPPQPQPPPQPPPQQPGPPQPPPAALRAQALQRATPEEQEIIQGSNGTPSQIEAYMRSGGKVGWMEPRELATRIQLMAPDAPPAAKFKAFQKGMNLLNQNGQQQFNQMMQMLQYQQRERFHSDTERKADERQRASDERLRMQDERMLRNSPYVKRQEQAAAAAEKNLTNTELRMDKIQGHASALADLAKQVQITGNMTIDTYLQEARRKLGWGAETYTKYQIQLENLKAEIAAMSSQTMGALTVSAREDARHLANGVLTPGILRAISEAVAIEGRITREATRKIIGRHQGNIDYYMQNRMPAPEEEQQAPAAPPAAGGGGTSGWH